MNRVTHTLPEAAALLRRRPRWLLEWLRQHPLGLDDRPLFMQAGRDKLFTDADIGRIQEVMRQEAVPCPSSSSRPAKENRRISRSAAHTSASILNEALALASGRSQPASSQKSSATLKLVR
ncbi:MAG: hypothetical protein KF826_15775 [Xanthobacteraceae bacterium]|nr:hypothetical protein [Xanthobacteraceae bacterium]MCW5678409.1 hypothetical protein [Xanthobacteraceae bacterium]